MQIDDLLDDYRQQPCLPDPDHQILQWKAKRDRFDHRHAFKRYLCSPRSEDVVSWTVFRSLEKAGALSGLSRFLGISDIRQILYWLWHADVHTSPEQLSLNNTILEVDGQLGGQMTEPDLVVFGHEDVCFVEAKLGEPARRPTLWASSEAKRWSLYEGFLKGKGIALFARDLSEGEQQEFYQLIRNVFYSWLVGHRRKLRPTVVCLVNESNWDAPTRTIREAFADFAKLLSPVGSVPQVRLLTWQQLAKSLSTGAPAEVEVATFLRGHPCLS
jgi:hypothetical protein